MQKIKIAGSLMDLTHTSSLVNNIIIKNITELDL